MTSVLDLKNPKNHKAKRNHGISDILNSGSAEEIEPEPVSEEDFFKRLETPDVFDKKEQIPNNSPDMNLPATLTHAPLEAARARSESLPLMGSLSWTAPEFHQELISHTWRKLLIVILVAMAFLAFFWQNSLLTALTFLALAAVVSMHFWREPKHQEHQIHPHGIVVNGRFYHYRDLDSFWIHYHPEGYHELSLCTGELLNYYLKIPLGSQDPFEVRDALMMYLPEEPHQEGLEDWLRRKLGL